jgi:hypothetical protein
MKFFSMTIIVGHVVVTYLGLQKHKNDCEVVIFGHEFLNIA